MSSPDLAAAPSAVPGTPPPAPLPTTVSRLPLRSAKIQDRHLAQLAIVYVRQSSPQQVLEHRESRERQYALADHAIALGWPKDRVLVIDEDQGQSGRTADDRAGFQRLVAEVTMNHVGLVLGLEVSRLARCNKDWHDLYELCAIFQTLLADEDGVYDASDPNDRLILGLKGMMSEVELLTMRNRLERGKRHKAERGELFTVVPLGYVRLPSGGVALDPDEQVQAVIRLIFEKFEELGSVYAVFHYLVRNGLRVGVRARRGPKRGQVEWRRPALATLFALLHNPIYAGAYAYGREAKGRGLPGGGHAKAGSRSVPMAEWSVLIRDRLPAYISWERYVENQARLRQNRLSGDSPGVPRRGAALLAGLLVCGRCGARMQPVYQARGRAYYHCVRHLLRGTERTCHGLAAGVVDDLVAAEVLRALAPAALELSLKAVEDIQKERQRLERHWRQRLERARYEAERAERQYRTVEPENRLVARTLERCWEEALQAAARVQEDYDRFLHTLPLPLGAEGRARVRALAEDIPALWQAPTTTAADRKEVVRCLIERVVVQVRPDSEQVAVTIHWQGGATTEHAVARPVRRYEQLGNFEQLLGRIMALRQEGQTAAAVAAQLNREGYRTPKGRGEFTEDLIRKLLSRQGLTEEKIFADRLGPQEWWLGDLARELRMSPLKLRDWAARGWLHGRQLPSRGRWVVWADRDEIKRLRKLRARSQRGILSHPEELTTPKKRKDK
jgi:DNA invertase Pin-like site-specific DNA recombinase